MEAWKKVGPDETVKVGWRTLTRKNFILPDGTTSEFTIKDAPDARCGAVIALTPEKTVIVAEQFRAGPEKIMQELPGGGIGPDEDPQDAVMRELLEESGYASENVEFLGVAYNDAYSNSSRYFYLARDCQKVGEQQLDEGEFITTKFISISELFDNARSGNMTDIGAVFLAYERLMELDREGE